MRALIIGAGSVGIGIGASIISSGIETDFYARGNTYKAIKENGIKRCGLFGDIEIDKDHVKVYDNYDDIPGSYDFIGVASKTLANAEVALELSKHRNIIGNGKIIILQNGWGNNDEFLKYFDKDMIYNARIITGFARELPNVSRITVHTAPILIGSLYGYDSSAVAEFAKAINASGLESDVTDEVGKALWAKMLFNTTLNPLGAILNTSYGEMSERAHARVIMDRLIEETYAVIEAEGYDTFWETPEQYKDVFYNKLVADTYKHRSSTLQDIEKKQKTEIDVLNGCVVRLAKKHGISVPTHEMICLLIKTLEDGME